ncbi:MAG: hypothetical protein R2710_05835 [Acidimicrobiales bacterium]
MRSRGGRPDLAGLHLHSVKAPTLLIVGGNDDVVLGLNEMAEAELRCESELRVVPGATHVFEEPGTPRLPPSWRGTGSSVTKHRCPPDGWSCGVGPPLLDVRVGPGANRAD